jgi:hypothetical protein
MAETRLNPEASGIDSLRLEALGRIPRCMDCPRYKALAAGRRRSELPEVPTGCTFVVCAPLAGEHRPGLGCPAEAA